MSQTNLHSAYYRNRQSEQELCCDFPGDELFINGLHAMQVHFYNNGTNIEIPILRVMNTAHSLAAYMFATTCSGDQLEYDALADYSLGKDRRLFKVVIIVLAAMLKRTEGFRARNCRNMLLDNRDPDFDEGVTLYDRFLSSAETRFAEENFLIDTNALITQLHEKEDIIAQQATEIQTLNYTITTMKEQLTQINIYGTQNHNCTQIGTQIIYNYSPTTSAQAEEHHVEPEEVKAENVQPVVTCPFIVTERLNELELYTIEQFTDMYRSAAAQEAKVLAEFLRKYEQLGVLNFRGLNKKEIFSTIVAFFPDQIKYGYSNFAYYF